jgi:hypothetical protein
MSLAGTAASGHSARVKSPYDQQSRAAMGVAAPGSSQPDPAVAELERRGVPDRRRRFWWALLYGSFNPRRRVPRRIGGGVQLVDWHHSRLLAVVLAILILCVTDAFLTLILLQSGAHEANPVMATVVYQDAKTFTILKMFMTSCSVAVMVMLAGYRFLGVFRVELLLYLVLTGYISLVGYELWMMMELGNWPLRIG